MEQSDSLTFESELNIVTISIIFGMIGILSSILFQLRNIRKEHNNSLTKAIADAANEKAETTAIRREFRNCLTDLTRRVDRLESILFHLPRESNPNSWY